MAKRRFVIATVVLIVGLSVAAQQRRPSQASIQGVWRVVEETSGGRTITDPNLGFIIYTAKHYALVRETGNKPRPDVSDVDHATAEQLLAMWGRFAAQFGTYEVNGDLVTLNILVAKNPSLMKPGRFGGSNWKGIRSWTRRSAIKVGRRCPSRLA